jgi:DNA-binding SARP family transcriptional activator
MIAETIDHPISPSIPSSQKESLKVSRLEFRLFGKLAVSRDAEVVKGLDSVKEQELLGYILTHRRKHHSRESLATLLWPDVSPEKGKKYLRQALWHLQGLLGSTESGATDVFHVEHDWIILNSQSDIWSDVAVFEEAFASVQGIPGKDLSDDNAKTLKLVADLYRGDLLDAWYQDWCLFERERLQNIYLAMLDKLIAYCGVRGEYDAGVTYGYALLSFDGARERTHRALMQLKYMAGDRTGALRQYQRCVTALAEELGVEPDDRTRYLYERIRTDSLNQSGVHDGDGSLPTRGSLSEILAHLTRLQLFLGSAQKRIQRDIKAVELELKSPKH